MQNKVGADMRKALLLSNDLYRKISEFRFKNRIASEQEAFRYLLECGLVAIEGTDAEYTANATEVSASAP